MREIEIEPIEGEWAHLMNEEAYAKFREEGNHYHISICFESDFNTDELRSELDTLKKDWGDWSRYAFHAAYLGAKAYMELRDTDFVYKAIKKLHENGYYSNRTIHISL